MTTNAEDGGDKSVRLKKSFGVATCVTIIIGLIISATIFISPTGVIKGTHSGGMALVVWGVCGALSMLGALIFAELATTFRLSGGMYVYLEEFYSPAVGFLFFWDYYLFHRPAANAIKCLTFAIYILQAVFYDCEPPAGTVVLLAILLAISVTFINILNVQVTARLQDTAVLLVMLSLTFLISVGIYHTASGGETHLSHMFANTNSNMADIVLSFLPGLYTFGGWEAGTYLVEEVKNVKRFVQKDLLYHDICCCIHQRPLAPHYVAARTLPLAMCISIIVVTVMYISINVAYLSVLGEDGVMTSPAVAGSLLRTVIGPSALIIMPIITTFASIESINSGTIVASRLGFVSARRGHLPSVLSLIQLKYLTPVTSLVLQMILVSLYCMGNVFFIMRNVSYAYTVFQILTVIGNIYHRYKHPDFHRPLKINLVFHIMYVLCLLFLTIVPLVTKPMSCVLGLALVIATGLPYYVIFVVKPFKMDILDRFSGRVLILVQKLLFAGQPDKMPTFSD